MHQNETIKMKDLLNENILETCPKCGEGNFERVSKKASGWRKLLSIIMSFNTLTRAKHHTYHLVCKRCGTEKSW